jgi:hypothetical protein
LQYFQIANNSRAPIVAIGALLGAMVVRKIGRRPTPLLVANHRRKRDKIHFAGTASGRLLPVTIPLRDSPLSNAKRLFNKSRFQRCDRLESANNGLCYLRALVATDYSLQKFDPGSLSFFVAFCCGNKLVLEYGSEISINGAQMSSACHQN